VKNFSLIRTPRAIRFFAFILIALAAIVTSGCWKSSNSSSSKSKVKLVDEIPAVALDKVLEAHALGLGHMERYDYKKAAEQFRIVRNLAPGWIPGSINMAIALLNDSGAAIAEKKKKEGQTEAASAVSETPAPESDQFSEPIRLLDEVIDRDPLNLHAHFCKGLIYKQIGKTEEAHREFELVKEKDPNDAHAWMFFGDTLLVKNAEGKLDLPRAGDSDILIDIYTKALACDPYSNAALYKLQSANRLAIANLQSQIEKAKREAGGAAKVKELSARQDEVRRKLIEYGALWRKLNPQNNAAAPGELPSEAYGDTGKYATVINPEPRRAAPAGPVRTPQFSGITPLRVQLPADTRWVKESDFTGEFEPLGRARKRFGAASAAFDYDHDGRLDLYLAAAVVGPKGVRDALLLNRDDYSFEDVTIQVGLPDDFASLAIAASDFDADRNVDLFLAGVGESRLMRDNGERFIDVSKLAGFDKLPKGVCVAARWLDIDQDGDLDLYIVNYTSMERAGDAFSAKTAAGMRNIALRNDGKPARMSGPEETWAPAATAPLNIKSTKGLSIAFTRWPNNDAIEAGETPHTGFAALDLDGDRDLDFVVVADGAPPLAILNDRLGRFHTATLKDIDLQTSLSGILVIDLDKDGKPDLATIGFEGKVQPWLNRTTMFQGNVTFSFKPFPSPAGDWRYGLATDLDLDTWPDLVGLPALTDPVRSTTVEWLRNEGDKLARGSLSLGPDSAGTPPGPIVGILYRNIVGNELPDMLVRRDGEPPLVAASRGDGAHWLGLELGGGWKVGKDRMRSNPHAIGASFSFDGRDLKATYQHTTNDTGPAQSAAPITIGLGKSERVDALRIRWPDSIIQAELAIPADQVFRLAELNRKQDSCPVLFTWDGTKFACAGDFLGAGVLGYLDAPGVIARPDRDETLPIPDGLLVPRDGTLGIAVAEPMDESAYIDQLIIDVVDRPADASFAADERFATGADLPSGKLIAWKKPVEFVKATDLNGKDISDKLRYNDRNYIDDFHELSGLIGYCEEHGIVLDFGDRLSRFGPNDRLTLCLAGWVEYSRSQTNYAAATAGIKLEPPRIERLCADGTWLVIEPHAGFPAGTPRMSTIDLSGKLGGERCVLRIRTNMKLCWDQAFIAPLDPSIELKTTSLSPARARLSFRGYMREVSPDGKPPALYDYNSIEAAPLSRLLGMYTRYGDVTTLLTDDDDHLCVMSPGDEIVVDFDASKLGDPPAGWKRSYVLRSIGYCKDADLFSATDDRVGPLPWKGMKSYPFGREGERPLDPAYEAYLLEYQTRASNSQ
jgi:tetratricopeptide (TPR) repeat protein